MKNPNRFIILAFLVIPLMACATRIPAAPESVAAKMLQDRVEPGWTGEGKYFVPAPDAPAEQILAFLAGANSEAGAFAVLDAPAPDPGSEVFHITPDIRLRLLHAAEDRPADLPWAIPYLPQDDATHKAVRQLYDQAKARSFGGMPGYWEKTVYHWLMRKGDFPEDLKAAAGEAQFDGIELQHEADLQALCEYDWAAAGPLLSELAKQSSLMSAVRDGFEFKHALAQNTGEVQAWRGKLESLATSKAADPGARAFAIKALLSVDWPGQESFALSLLPDATLYNLHDESHTFPWPLQDWMQDDAHMQRVVELLEYPQSDLHAWAGRALDASGRLDAMRIMYRHRDAWPVSASQERLELLGWLRMPESADWLAEFSGPAGPVWSGEMLDAALALAHQNPARAAPYLRALMPHADQVSPPDSARFLVALARSGALTDDQWYDFITSGSFFDLFDEGWANEAEAPLAQALGTHDALAARLIAFQRLIPPAPESEGRNRADDVRSLLRLWPAPDADAYLLECLTTQPLNAYFVELTTKHPLLAAHQAPALRRLAHAGGPLAGVAAAAALDDAALDRSILKGSDGPATQMLLACTRLSRRELPITLVGDLLNGSDPALATAAEKWLISNDSPAAQELVRRHHPGTLLVLGGGQMLPDDDPSFAPRVERLRRQMTAPDGPDEAFALLVGGGFPDAGDRTILIRNGITTLTFYGDQASKLNRQLSAAELATLRGLIARYDIDNLPTMSNDVLDGITYTYVHLTRTSGRMVQIDNPGIAGTPHDLLVRRFRALSDAVTQATPVLAPPIGERGP